jgi:hypothetical protein
LHTEIIKVKARQVTHKVIKIKVRQVPLFINGNKSKGNTSAAYNGKVIKVKVRKVALSIER